MIYWQLICVYLKIGVFGFGGGYAMLSLIQFEIVERYHWLTLQQFTDVVAISQMTPGPIGINSATYIGDTVTGNIWGAGIVDFIFLCQIQKQQICQCRHVGVASYVCSFDWGGCFVIDE